MQVTKDIQNYFEKLKKDVKIAYELAQKARKKNLDPETKVEPILAENMAQRVEGLISVVAPQIVNSGVSKRITSLEKEYGFLDWRVSLIIAEEVAREKFCKFKDKIEAIETGIRVGFAYHTLGTVASPLEGFTNIKIRKRKDGKEYFAIRYSGPIRSAGGTGACVSVIIVDYIRKKMGYHAYDPTEKEIKRMVTEIKDYHERAANLQYLPTEKEIEFLTKHLPVQLDGEPTSKMMVSNYKDIERIDTNQIRGGACLVLAEGLAQKAPKLWKQLSIWGSSFDLDWGFLEEFLIIQKNIKAKNTIEFKEETDKKTRPDYTFIKDLPAGRPVLTHPLRFGGFRLRYGRCRNSGYSSCGIHPSTMHILNNYIATGTQLKVERPGKATALTPCDSIEGPIVELTNGNVIRLNSEKDAKKIKKKDIQTIFFLGDLLVSYGDFFNRAHPLIPPGYCEEWYVQELEKAIVGLFGNLDLDKSVELIDINKNDLERFLENPLKHKIDIFTAIKLSNKLNIPLHPYYTYYWNCISLDDFNKLVDWINLAKIVKENHIIKKIVLPLKEEEKKILGLIGLPHLNVNNEFIVIEKEDANGLAISLGITDSFDYNKIKKLIRENKNVLDVINFVSEIEIRDKSGIFIGARMGRPEKAKMRKLQGSPHVLFPVGEQGGKMRCFQKAFEAGKVKAEFPIYKCNKCNKETIYGVCEICEKKTEKRYYCNICGLIKKPCFKNGHNSKPFRNLEIDINHYFKSSLKKINMKTYPDLIKGVRGTSNANHVIENLAKGILRAKHDIYVNKDGTTRYDMTQLVITHFKPKEIGTNVDKLIELGYLVDKDGNELKEESQILELKPQDIILPKCTNSKEKGSDEILFRVSRYIDDLLKSFYGLDSFYNMKKKEDLVGHLVVALAPHTSAAILARIIGFSQTQGFFAHPILHAATRRDCDGDEACVILLMDVLLNFSRKFLPNSRGSTQDTCLVLTYNVKSTEVDDMFFDLDVVSKYPLEFYEACLEYKNPWDVKIEKIKERLGTEKQYVGLEYTHEITNINMGVRCSAYKLLPSMEEKLKGQMDLAEKIRAVDTSDVAKLVIEKHFLKDIKGNLRRFSSQKFRCSICNEIYRRITLSGKCTKCNNNLVFTVSEGTVIKYLEPSISLANKYGVDPYLKQTLALLKLRIESVFGKEKERQVGLGSWFG